MILKFQEIEKLCAELESATKTVIYFFNKETSAELREALAALWDSCEEYKTAFENFSHE